MQGLMSSIYLWIARTLSNLPECVCSLACIHNLPDHQWYAELMRPSHSLNLLWKNVFTFVCHLKKKIAIVSNNVPEMCAFSTFAPNRVNPSWGESKATSFYSSPHPSKTTMIISQWWEWAEQEMPQVLKHHSQFSLKAQWFFLNKCFLHIFI